MAVIDFGGVKEEVITRDEFPMEKALEVLKDETIAVIGYGVQGPAQALNMRDNGCPVIIGQWEGAKQARGRRVPFGFISCLRPLKGSQWSTFRLRKGLSSQRLTPGVAF